MVSLYLTTTDSCNLAGQSRSYYNPSMTDDLHKELYRRVGHLEGRISVNEALVNKLSEDGVLMRAEMKAGHAKIDQKLDKIGETVATLRTHQSHFAGAKTALAWVIGLSVPVVGIILAILGLT